jgi:hypothetical protein
MTWIEHKKVHLFGIAFFFLFDFIFYYARVITYLGLPLSIYLFICLVFALHIWFFNYLIVYLVHHRLPGLQQRLTKRLIAFLMVIPISVLLSTLFQSFFFSLLNNNTGPGKFFVHYEDIGTNLLYSLIIVFFLELRYYFQHWTKAVTQTAELQQRNMEAQLDSLRNQVSPHFLFNSLNSLSSLILQSPEQAVTFVHKLSSVYRYLLQRKDKNLVELKEELNFLQSYLHLLQTRFGRAFQCDVQISHLQEQYLIPPFTLQLLVENAVKHNVVAIDEPLFIEVYTHDDRIVVKNSLQKRKGTVPSTGIGLVHIISKYALVTDTEVEITETNEAFVVTLPLINPITHERTDYRR